METLISIKDLLKKSFSLYVDNAWMFIKLMALNAVLFIAMMPFGFLAFGGFAAERVNLGLVGILLFLIILIPVIIFGITLQATLIFAVRERGLTIKQYIAKGWQVWTSYAWIAILCGLVTMGGFILLIIPGIVFAVWFAFSNYIMVNEGTKGWAALMRSKELVKGYWWAVFGRVALLVIFCMLVSMIPLLGDLLNLFFIAPFAVIYMYATYEDLKRIKVTTI